MIGASASALMARMRLAPLQPAMCWVAPEIPQAMYRSGAILVPVWPTWSEWGRQPALVTTREQPTAAPSRPASSRSEEHTSELQSLAYLVCRLLLEKKKK